MDPHNAHIYCVSTSLGELEDQQVALLHNLYFVAKPFPLFSQRPFSLGPFLC